MTWLAAAIVMVGALLGLALTMATLPGIWVMIVTALLVEWWKPEMFSWWTLGTAIGIGVLAEGAELGLSAVGAKRVGGTRRGAVGSIIGAIGGAILGAPFFPPIGIIAGAAIGAGVGAMLAEGYDGRKTWKESAVVGTGAAAGRLVATFVKLGFAVVIALMLSIAAFVP